MPSSGSIEKKIIRNTATHINHCNRTIAGLFFKKFIFKNTKVFGFTSGLSTVGTNYSIYALIFSMIAHNEFRSTVIEFVTQTVKNTSNGVEIISFSRKIGQTLFCN